MYTQELLVHHCRQRQCTKRIHASIINLLGVFVFAFQLEGEVIREMSAFVVSSEKPETVWIPDFQTPQIQHTLQPMF